MNNSFSDLVSALATRRPLKKVEGQDVFYYKDHPVRLKDGSLDDINWVDIRIELSRYRVDNLNSANKILQANLEMGESTPIPTWFAADQAGRVIFVNRLDWKHLSADILDAHIIRCIDQMSEALSAEGV